MDYPFAVSGRRKVLSEVHQQFLTLVVMVCLDGEKHSVMVASENVVSPFW
jgi:hypothetical protein